MTDIKTRIAMARQRFGKLRHIWSNKELHLNLRLRLYKSCVCSVQTYGSEAWQLHEEARRTLNGANSQMLSIITDKTPHQEASAKWRTFDLVAWIRARRLQWLGHILRMGPERKIKQAVFELFKAPTEGNLLMDAPVVGSWKELCTYAMDREYWRTRVRKMKQPRVHIQMGPHVAEGSWAPFTISV